MSPSFLGAFSGFCMFLIMGFTSLVLESSWHPNGATLIICILVGASCAHLVHSAVITWQTAK